MAKILNYGFELTCDDLLRLSELGVDWFCYSRFDTEYQFKKYLLVVYFFNSNNKEVAFLTLMSSELQTYDAGLRNWGDTPEQIKAGTYPPLPI